MESQPLVRARFCQEWLEFVAKEDEPLRSRFLSHVDPALREEIESASRVAWLPLSVHVKLADVLQESYGAVRAHQYYRRAFAASLRGPILGPLVRTGAKVLGVSVATFVRWAPRGWEASYRNAGEMHGEVIGEDHAKVVFSGLPPVCIASDGWMLSAQGSAYGMYDTLGIDGVVRVDLSRRSEGRMVLDLEWNRTGVRAPTIPPP
jgi:hypothetical protein